MEDWEARYKELKRRVDQVYMPLLRSALKIVDQNEDDDASPYVNKIAPITADLPNIMTMCSPAEREVLVKRAQEKLTPQGDWQGPWTGRATKDKPKGARPSLQMVTDYGRTQVASGAKRRKRIHASGNVGTHSTTFPVTHVLLIGEGRYPTETRNYASHICHNGTCLNVAHVIWESASHNLRRERICRMDNTCRCGLNPPCDFSLHK